MERFAPVTPATAGDLEQFSLSYGTFRWCSCMRWRLRSAPFAAAGKEGRAERLARQVRDGQPAGVLAYDGVSAVGWCSVAPRESYAAVLASRVIPQVPGERVWSVACFFIAPRARGTGLRFRLLEAACQYAADQGAEIIEAYPSPNRKSYRYMGTRRLYLALGFEDVEVPAGRRPVLRRYLRAAQRGGPTAVRPAQGG